MTVPESPALKRVLGFPAVLFIMIGFTIGAGIFVFTGLVAKMVGPLLPWAYLAAMFPVALGMLPVAFLAIVAPVAGGNYLYPSRFLSPRLAFTAIWVYALTSFYGQIPLYALSAGQYAASIWPGISPLAVAVGLLTVLCITNIVGVRLAAMLQGLMVLILIVVLLYYAQGGLRYPAANYQSPPPGVGTFVLGVALLSFTYFGANGIIELGAEIKNPARTVTRAYLLSFPLIALLYVLVAWATVRVTAPETLAQQDNPLVYVARATLGATGMRIFILGGALLAITTTLNALFLVGTKSLFMMAKDRLLPAGWFSLHPRFGTPVRLLILIWGLSVAGLLTCPSLETLATFAALGAILVVIPVMLSAVKVGKKLKHEGRDLPLFSSMRWLYFCAVMCGSLLAFLALVLVVSLESAVKIGLFVLFVLSGWGFYEWRRRHLAQQGLMVEQVILQEREELIP